MILTVMVGRGTMQIRVELSPGLKRFLLVLEYVAVVSEYCKATDNPKETIASFNKGMVERERADEDSEGDLARLYSGLLARSFSFFFTVLVQVTKTTSNDQLKRTHERENIYWIPVCTKV